VQDEQGRLGTKRAYIRERGAPGLAHGGRPIFVGRGDGTFAREGRKVEGAENGETASKPKHRKPVRPPTWHPDLAQEQKLLISSRGGEKGRE